MMWVFFLIPKVKLYLATEKKYAEVFNMRNTFPYLCGG